MHVVGRWSEIFALQYLERLLLDRPAGDKGAIRAVLSNNSRIWRSCCRIDLMIHQYGELSPCTLERAQAVRNSYHPVTADAVTDRQNRNEFHARYTRNQIWLGRRARADVGSRSGFAWEQ